MSDLPTNPGKAEPAPQIICRKTKRQGYFHQRGKVADPDQMHEQLLHVAGIYNNLIFAAIQFPAVSNFSRNNLAIAHFDQRPKGSFRPIRNREIVFKGGGGRLCKTGPPRFDSKPLPAHRFINRINGYIVNGCRCLLTGHGTARKQKRL